MMELINVQVLFTKNLLSDQKAKFSTNDSHIEHCITGISVDMAKSFSNYSKIRGLLMENMLLEDLKICVNSLIGHVILAAVYAVCVCVSVWLSFLAR